MPNKMSGFKRNAKRTGHKSIRSYRKTVSVQALLSRGVTLGRVAAQVSRQQDWASWLKERLPAELAGRLSGVVERGGTLVVLTESSGWSARVRYAVAEMDGAIKAQGPDIQRVEVRVMPRR